MRNISLFSFGLLLTALASAACGGNAVEGSGGSGGSGSGAGSTGSAGASSGVTGTAQGLFQPTTGDVLKPATGLISIAARVGQGASAQIFPGTIDADTKFDIPNVPVGSYLLDVTTEPSGTFTGAQPFRTFYESDARVIDIGTTYSGRPDTKALTQPTYLALNGALTVPLQVYTDDGMGNVQPLEDQFELISRGAMVVGYVSPTASSREDNAPLNGATNLTGWKINAQDAFIGLTDHTPLIEQDDFAILHDVRKQVGMPTPDGNPWNGYSYTSTQAALFPAPFTMTNGGTSTLTGTFEPVAQKDFVLDYKGAAFNQMLANVPVDLQFANASVYLEAGSPNPAVGTFADLLEIDVTSGIAYTNQDPACQGAGCDTTACATSCDPGTIALIGDHSHTYSYGNPFDYGQELGGVLIQFQKRVTTLLPEMTSERLRGLIGMSAPVAEVSGKPIQPTIGFPQNIKIGGMNTPYDQVTMGVTTTPTVSWDAPSLGQATYYRVVVVDTTDLTDTNGTISRRRNVARFILANTTSSVSIPDGILKPGKFYYLEVSAVTQDSLDPAAPAKQPQRSAYATMFTGLVTP